MLDDIFVLGIVVLDDIVVLENIVVLFWGLFVSNVWDS